MMLMMMFVLNNDHDHAKNDPYQIMVLRNMHTSIGDLLADTIVAPVGAAGDDW